VNARQGERCVSTAFGALCAYEAAAVTTRRVPTISALCRGNRWVEAGLLGFLLLHLHPRAAAEAPVLPLEMAR